MPRYIAFLRAVNVGGHTVKMDALRALFQELGFNGVETFIASGNVIFNSDLADGRAHEAQIEALLERELGYAVATFVRTPAELAAIANHVAFPQAELDSAQALNVAFLAERLEEAAIQKLFGLRTDIDDFAVHSCEVYWLCLKRQSESTFSNHVFEKTLGRQATFRGINTVRKLAEKYAAGA